jgi:hypothetical protein
MLCVASESFRQIMDWVNQAKSNCEHAEKNKKLAFIAIHNQIVRGLKRRFPERFKIDKRPE